MSGQQLDPQMIQQILAMLRQQNADPFNKPMPGEGLLGAGGMSQGSGMPQGGGGFAQNLPTSAPMSAMPNDQQVAPNATATIPTDFADTQPGLPNLPDSFTGFGFGQFAPKQMQPVGIRQQLIQQIMNGNRGGGMPNMMGGGSSMNGGFQ